MLVKTYTAALHGIDALPVTVEANTTHSLGCLTIVGLPDNAVKESEQRIRSAISVNGYRFPQKGLVINMAPADLKKEGASFDLSIAIAILAANEEVLTLRLGDFMMLGELSLDGTLQPVKGALSIALRARQEGLRGIILPESSAAEAAVISGLEVYAMNNLRDVVRFLNGEQQTEPLHIDINTLFQHQQTGSDIDFADVRGQENIKRAMEVAAAGGHNMLMIGPPGAGKSMLAKRLPGILPPLTLEEALETTKIHSVAGTLAARQSLLTQRPFRSPHHTVSDVALVGGGINPMPGEISLAHNGVLFLDELPEYKRSALEVMRQPLEDRKICISRAKMSIEYPASFMLVAAMNPCPCGHYNDPTHECTCSPGAVQRYLSRISGPLLDRIDIQVEITPVPFAELHKQEQGETSAAIRERVCKARLIQQQRFSGTQVYCNAQMNSKQMRKYCTLDKQGSELIKFAMEKLGLSARAYDRILKVARTIADLDPASTTDKPVDITPAHLSEAINYRALDRTGWGS
ncbi:MAG: YifB family Mg chelatase-like AAA ATPase [Paludibacteraceae bacterium]|nr:YifB family Mg chelatase-like AAA ATPase [Paludibacteraceae bacterium]